MVDQLFEDEGVVLGRLYREDKRKVVVVNI